MDLIRKLLIPFVPIYCLVTWLRNKLYDLGIKKSMVYDFPVIVVGNLSVGGTGKSPMIEYLILLLKDTMKVATLSRGYKRATKGFQLANENTKAIEIGDEPFQFNAKFENILVAVDADRRNGISELRKQDPKPQVILLDDAYQHRKVKAGFYILLTAYYDLYYNDILLPTGNLREPRKGAERADLIVVTKCPKKLTQEQKTEITRRILPKKHQTLLFASIAYSDQVIGTSQKRAITSFENISFTLVTGIANPKPLVDYYNSLGLQFDHISFPDHHNFTEKEITTLKKEKVIITTEKDYVRLSGNFLHNQLWYQPITTVFIDDQNVFDKRILSYIQEAVK